MKEHLDKMQQCASHLEMACCDLEKSAETLEELLSQHIAETPVEKAGYELLKESIDLLCTLSKCQAADSRGLHHHLSEHHKTAA